MTLLLYFRSTHLGKKNPYFYHNSKTEFFHSVLMKKSIKHQFQNLGLQHKDIFNSQIIYLIWKSPFLNFKDHPNTWKVYLLFFSGLVLNWKWSWKSAQNIKQTFWTYSNVLLLKIYSDAGFYYYDTYQSTGVMLTMKQKKRLKQHPIPQSNLW